METGNENTISGDASVQEDIVANSEKQYIYNHVQTGSDSNYVVDISASDQQLIQQLIQKPSVSDRSRIEQALIAAVKEEVANRLQFSSRNILLDIDKQIQTEYSTNQKDWTHRDDLPTNSSLIQTKIIDIFDRPHIDGKLLILGEPGSGKTTALLQLAQDLVERAEADSQHAIPILLNLSTWNQSYRNLQRWIESELKLKYGVRPDVSKRWVDRKRLLPLLDGLDEVSIVNQATCIEEIDLWIHNEKSDSLVVCSRLEYYENQNHFVHLSGAIQLQGLRDKQIQQYFEALDVSSFWQFLRDDQRFLDLLRQPLMLSIATLVYKEMSIKNRDSFSSAIEFRESLLDAYVHRMLSRPLGNHLYSQKQVTSSRQARRWLVWLAREMEDRNSTEFFIEQITPTWLESHSQVKAYRLMTGFLWGIVGSLCFGILFYSLTILVISFAVFLLLGFVLSHADIGYLSHNSQSKRTPNSSILNHLRRTLFVGVVSFLLLACLFWIVRDAATGLMIGSSASLLVILLFGNPVLQHLLVRIILWKDGNIPWNYARFLMYCSERSIIQRTGGCYRFVHSIVQKHFASMPR